jgi:hypothetical protein
MRNLNQEFTAKRRELMKAGAGKEVSFASARSSRWGPGCNAMKVLLAPVVSPQEEATAVAV